MSDEDSEISAYYNSDPMREHTRLERHQLEYDLTWRYLEQYLPRQGAILEVGAATGRYTLELARHGYAVTAVDFSADLLDACRRNLESAGLAARVRFVATDARDLGSVPETDFDAALLMGPLYHLFSETDRRVALRQVYDRLAPGGLLVSAFISRLGILGDLMKNLPEWIDDPREVYGLMKDGYRPQGVPPGGFHGYFARAEEITPMHESAGFETLVLVASEPAISADDESYNRLEGERRRRWLDLLYEISAEPSTLAASRHLLYIGRKSAA